MGLFPLADLSESHPELKKHGLVNDDADGGNKNA